MNLRKTARLTACSASTSSPKAVPSVGPPGRPSLAARDVQVAHFTRGLHHLFWPADHPRVLLAEDDPRMRRLIAGRLRRDGCLVLEALDGRQLVAAVSTELSRLQDGGRPIDIIIACAQLPGATGLEVLGAVRDFKWPVPFILLAASNAGEVRREGRRLGASATFEKPFELDDLVTAIALLVSQ
jgi:two-component system, response regulator, stage 0 sporulation protein F